MATTASLISVAVSAGRELEEEFIRYDRLGVATGQGFYSYPDPAYAAPGFV